MCFYVLLRYYPLFCVLLRPSLSFSVLLCLASSFSARFLNAHRRSSLSVNRLLAQSPPSDVLLGWRQLSDALTSNYAKFIQRLIMSRLAALSIASTRYPFVLPISKIMPQLITFPPNYLATALQTVNCYSKPKCLVLMKSTYGIIWFLSYVKSAPQSNYLQNKRRWYSQLIY